MDRIDDAGGDTTDRAGTPEGEARWALRPLMLTALGLATGIAVHLIAGPDYAGTPGRGVMTAVVGLLVSAGLIGFTLSRRLWWAGIAFSLTVGAIAAAVTWSNGPPAGWSMGEGWRMVSLSLAVAIAAPLFQSARDADALRFPYAAVHDHAWTNVVLWCACWAFVCIVFLLVGLLAALFDLIGIGFLADLMRENWFWSALVGLAFGAGLGLLREHDVVVRLLQRVVATVLSVLAPVLAAGLVLFVLALPFTGLGALWRATDNATPILLSCVIGALILVNAVIGNMPAHESRIAALRWGATALAFVVLPLAILAAIGTGMRIGQYGFTPQRLWALTFVVIACAYGVAYWGALIRARLDWPTQARSDNLTLAFGVMAVALLLATPLVSFNAISTADQVARLEAGKVSPDKFDWGALYYEYGAPGRAAVAHLQASSDPAIRERARKAADSRVVVTMAPPPSEEDRARLAQNLRIPPVNRPIPRELQDALAQFGRCKNREGQGGCTLYFSDGGKDALLLQNFCFDPARKTVCYQISRFVLVDGRWHASEGAPDPDGKEASRARRKALENGYATGAFEIRTVPRRQLYVGGQPVGDPFE